MKIMKKKTMKRAHEATGSNGVGAAPAAGGDRQARARRPNLPRSEPERSFAGVFSPGEPKSAPSATAPTGGPRPAKGRPPGVSEGVTAGYQVIEDYIRQGQDFARKFWSGTAADATSSRNNVAERMIRSASDLASLFSEFLQTVTLPPNRPSPGNAPIPDFGLPGSAKGPSPQATPAPNRRPNGAGDPQAQGDPPPAIWIDLRSRRRVEVSVELRPGEWRRALVAHDLRAADSSLARVPGPRIDTQLKERRVIVRLRVPDRHPPGVYSGLIIDGKTNLPCGTLALRIWRSDRAS
jgi:hypothetical protein